MWGSSFCAGPRLSPQGTQPAPPAPTHPGSRWSGHFQHLKQMEHGLPRLPRCALHTCVLSLSLERPLSHLLLRTR